MTAKRLRDDVDLVGLVVGSLTVLRQLDSDERGRRWLCECECGAQAIRPSSALMRSFRSGTDAACRECTNEARRGERVQWAAKRRSGWLEMFERMGSLWTHDTETALSIDIVAEIEAELGVRPDAQLPQCMRPIFWERPERKTATGHIVNAKGFGQDWYSLFPIRAKGSLFQCADCPKRDWRGWICVDCVAFVCHSCGRKEVHRHGAGLDEVTFAEALSRFSSVRPTHRQAKARKQRDGMIGFDLAEALP